MGPTATETVLFDQRASLSPPRALRKVAGLAADPAPAGGEAEDEVCPNDWLGLIREWSELLALLDEAGKADRDGPGSGASRPAEDGEPALPTRVVPASRAPVRPSRRSFLAMIRREAGV